jgi:hypothetical protein
MVCHPKPRGYPLVSRSDGLLCFGLLLDNLPAPLRLDWLAVAHARWSVGHDAKQAVRKCLIFKFALALGYGGPRRHFVTKDEAE